MIELLRAPMRQGRAQRLTRLYAKRRYLMASAAADGATLLGLLGLFGFEIKIEGGDDGLAGVTVRRPGRGRPLWVAASARGHGDLAWQLFEGALQLLDQELPRKRLGVHMPGVAA
jgi:hypothetical protein